MSEELPEPGSQLSRVALPLFISDLLLILRFAAIGDDSAVSFGVVDNFLRGYGLCWNMARRVPVAEVKRQGKFALSGQVLSVILVECRERKPTANCQLAYSLCWRPGSTGSDR